MTAGTVWNVTWTWANAAWGPHTTLCRCIRSGTIAVGSDLFTVVSYLCSACAIAEFEGRGGVSPVILTFPGHEDGDYQTGGA